MKTAEQIAKETNHLDGLANIRAINKLFRQQDGSKMAPVFGRINVTERAIRQCRKLQRQSGAVYGLEYCYMLDYQITTIINSQV